MRTTHEYRKACVSTYIGQIHLCSLMVPNDFVSMSVSQFRLQAVNRTSVFVRPILPRISSILPALWQVRPLTFCHSVPSFVLTIWMMPSQCCYQWRHVRRLLAQRLPSPKACLLLVQNPTALSYQSTKSPDVYPLCRTGNSFLHDLSRRMV